MVIGPGCISPSPGDPLNGTYLGSLGTLVVARCGRRGVLVLQSWPPPWPHWRGYVYKLSMRDAFESDMLAVAERQDPVMSFALEQLPGREILLISDIPHELDHASVFKNCTNGDEHPVFFPRLRGANPGRRRIAAHWHELLASPPA